MKQTTNYGLNILETADSLSMKPLNESAEKLDTALKGFAQQIEGRVMMAKGSYIGDGTLKVTLRTQGMQPQAVLVRKVDAIGAIAGGEELREENCGFRTGGFGGIGWSLWRGEDIAANYYDVSNEHEDPETGEMVTLYRAKPTTIRFTSEQNGVSWELAAELRMDHSALVNNEKGTIYEWIAFGSAQ